MMSTLFLPQPVANVIRPADSNDDRSEKILSTHKGVNSRLKDVIQKQEQTLERRHTETRTNTRVYGNSRLACESSARYINSTTGTFRKVIGYVCSQRRSSFV